MPTETPQAGNRRTLFPHKLRDQPICLTATATHHAMLAAAQQRLGLSRADVIGLLIEKHAEALALDGLPPLPAKPSPQLPVFGPYGVRSVRTDRERW